MDKKEMGGITFNAPVTVGTFVKVESGATYIKNNLPGVTTFSEQEEERKENEPLTEDVLREKVQTVRQHIGTTKRLWFPVCKYMMWHSMVGDGDFVGAVAILERMYPELHLDADDLSSLNVLSFSKTLKEWNPNDAPVKGAYFSKYFLIANLLGG